MTVSATGQFNLSVLETLTSLDLAASNPVSINQANETVSLGASTTPPATVVIHQQHTLSGTTHLLDLTDAPGTQGAAGDSDAVDASTMRIQMALFKNLSITNTLTIEADATNGQEFLGASGKIILPAATAAVPSMAVLCIPEAGSDITSAADDEILFTGTSGESFEYIFVCG